MNAAKRTGQEIAYSRGMKIGGMNALLDVKDFMQVAATVEEILELLENEKIYIPEPAQKDKISVALLYAWARVTGETELSGVFPALVERFGLSDR